MEIVSLLPLEQGTISGGVNTDSNTRCRTPGYFDLEGNPQSVQVNFAGTGGTLQISFIAFDANNTRVHSFYWHNSGTTIDISEYAANIAKFRCVLKFSNDATITPENITSAEVRYSKGWYVDEEDNLTNDELQTLLPSMEKPYPLSLWRVANGVLTNGLLAKLLGEDIWALHRKSQIYVYDLHEPQTGFNSNGLAALDPISCTSWHDDDRWDVELTHPLDEWGKWKYLLPENIIKVRGQLFRIDRYLPKISGSERSVSIHASHISTDMAAQIIRQATFPGGTAAQFIDFAFSSVDEPFYSEGLAPYRFEGYSNIAENLGETELVNTSLWAAIVGADNCLINRYGGELYRDNFYFSVYDRMQYAKDNAFRLRYSLDMTEISQTIDYTDFCTELHGRDNFGNEYAVWWNEGVSWAVHHPRQRAVSFTYSDFDTAFDSLVHDVEALFFASDYPKVTYEMSLANLKNDPRYADFLQLQDYQYGDSGSIYCPELDINTVQKIVAEQRDELTGDVLRMTLGNMKNSWVRPSLLAGTVSSGSSVEDKQRKALQEELKKAKLKALPDWKSARTYTWAEMRQFNWKELKNHGN